MKLLIVLMLFLSIGALNSEEIVRYDNYKLFQIIPRNPNAVKVLKNLELSETPEFEFWNSVRNVGAPVDVMVPPNKVADLKVLALSLESDIELLMDNVQEEIDLQQSQQTEVKSFGWTKYNTLDEINDWLRSLADIYAPVVTLIEGGVSYEGRIIYGIKISYSPNNENNSVFIESGIHSNEWISPAVTTYIFNELLSSTDPIVRQVAESHDWYFFPVFNPDGYAYAHRWNRLWRKTRTPHNLICRGADPNRNWAYFWNSGGSSDSHCSLTYHGPQPFSESSCRTLSEFITSVASKLVAYISFHSFLQLILLPYGYTGEHLDNYDEVHEIAVKAAEALSQRYGTQYTVGSTHDGIYPASGTSADWVKGTFKVPIVFTYELRDLGRYGFLLPASQIIPSGEETVDSFVTVFLEYEKLLLKKKEIN